MKQAKLEDLFDYLPKSKVKAGDGLEGGEYPFYTSSENQSKYLSDFQHGPGCLVFGTGGKASVHLTTSRFSTSTDCIAITPKSVARIDAGYVFQYFKGNMQVLENGFKGAGLKHISKAYLSDIQIPYPEEIDDQRRIAHLLGKVEGLIAQRKQHLQQLDDLLKSVFMGMFGVQVTSGPNATFGTYITTLSDYHANGSYETLKDHVQLLTAPNYALMVRTTDLENNNFSGGCNYISKDAYEFLGKSKVYGGEIIVNKIGSAGKVYLMPSLCRPVSLGMNAFLLRFNEDLNNIFAYHFLISDVGTQRIQKLVKGAVTKTITKDAIRSIAIPVIPPDRQNKFAVAAAKVENIKASYQQSLANLEALFDALSQQAFKGELDMSRVPIRSVEQEEEKTVAVDPLHTPPEQALVINLPDVSVLLDAVQGPVRKQDILRFWLESYLGQLGSAPLSVKHFMSDAQNRLAELNPDNYFELGANDYEYIKVWVFETLAAGRLQQSRNITRYEESGEPILGNLIELKLVQA